jgi:proline dehydrogenase
METSPAAQRLTSRFIAGNTLQQELAVCQGLNGEGILATLDHLGESVTSLAEAERSRDAYLSALDQIAALALKATVSVKLTQIGLDFSEEQCHANIERLVERAKAIGSVVEIDMESSVYVDRTLALVTNLHAKHGSVRAVIQAYLYRSESDIENLSKLSIPVRLCKGAYKEPSDLAFPDKNDVDNNYVRLMTRLLDHGAYPAIASHDEKIIQRALQYVKERNIAPDRFEFQMLYGINRDLQKRLVEAGHRLRLYVPYGDAWYPYFMRRLAERPANVVFLARNLLRS